MTKAMQVLFDENKRATGVKVQSAGRNYTLSAKHEVILSSGVFHSPQLLMVSGVGPRETLKQHNIPLIADRPGVGQNMHDTCNAGGVTFPVSVISTAIRQRDASYEARAVEQFNTNGSGILTNTGGDVLAFEKLPDSYRSHLSEATQNRLAAEWPADWPETEYALSSTGRTLEGSSATSENYVSIGVLLVGTLSRGNMTIQSGSMLDKPVISTNWLMDEADQEVAVQAYKRIREFWSHVNITTGPEERPGGNVTSDADLLEFIRGAVGPIHHATSTCEYRSRDFCSSVDGSNLLTNTTGMMGRANETMAVVDSEARVFGVSGLRVIDSSSFRFTPPGHTQAATCK
jgi:choline dehydrogenase